MKRLLLILLFLPIIGVSQQNFNGLFVPNSLAPDIENGGESRYFLPKGVSLLHYELMIFDKFGNLIFKTTELDSGGIPMYGWDGTKDGSPLPQGTYIWKIDAQFSDGSPWQGVEPDMKKSGAVYLIR